MDDVVKSIVGGAAVSIALGALGGCGLQSRSGDDRPPIVVTEGSLRMKHEKEWALEGSHPKRWKSKQQNGKAVRSFDVTITGIHTSECSTKLNGKLAVIDFFVPDEDEPRRFVVYLDRDQGNKLQPVVDSTVELTPDSSDPTLLNHGTPGVGSIMRLDVLGGSVSGSCTFTTDAKPEIEFKFVQ